MTEVMLGRLQESELTLENLQGATIYGAQDQKLGKVSDLQGGGAAAALLIDVGGLLGIGAKRVALPLAFMDFVRGDGGNIYALTAWTKDQLTRLPEVET